MLGFDHEAHGVHDLGFSDQDATVDHTAADVEGDGAGFQASGGALGEGGLFGDIDDSACARALIHDGRGLGPASDDFGGGEDGLEVGADAADQSGATDGHEDGVKSWKLPVEFDGDGSLPGHDVQVVIG